MRFLAVTTLVVSALLVAGCEDRLPALSTAPTELPSASRSVVTFGAEDWNLTPIFTSFTGPVVCWAPVTNIGTAARNLFLGISRSADSIRLRVSYGWDDPETYVGTVVGQDFVAIGPSHNGYNVCGPTQHHWRIEQRVSGRFSSDGRSLSASEVWLYKLPDGDEVTYYIDWKATRRD
jgi:hypothetical protein